MIQAHKNALKRKPQLSMEQSARINYLSRGLNQGASRFVSGSNRTIKTGTTASLTTIIGFGFVSTIFIRITCEKNQDLVNARVKIREGKENEYSINQPLQDFFMSGLEGKDVVSDYAGKITSDDQMSTAYYRNIFVPYNHSLVFDIENQGQEDITLDYSLHYHEDNTAVDFGRYNKAYGCSVKGSSDKWGEEIVLLDIRGKGTLNSIQMSLNNALTRGQYMEGNIEIYIDDNPFPEYQSTGTEEFFMGGVYFINLHTSAYSGCTRTFNDGSENPQNIISAQRYFVDDPITFNRRLKFVWHNGQPEQGAVVGTTDYNFSFVYYLDGTSNYYQGRIGTEEAIKMLAQIDHDRFERKLHSIHNTVDLVAGEAEILSLHGEGSVENIYLAFDKDISASNSRIILDIDGYRTDSIPIELFFFNSKREKGYTSIAGKVAKSTFYKRCSIDYSRSLSIIIQSDDNNKAIIGCEYRFGEPTCSYVYGIKEIRGRDDGMHIPLLSENDTTGIIEAIIINSHREQNLVLEFLNADNMPIGVERVADFFFSPNRESTLSGVASEIGILENNNENYLAFRRFNKCNFSFNRGFKIRVHNIGEINQIILFYKIKKTVKSKKMFSIKQIEQRINMNDWAQEYYETSCYNPIEGRDGLIPAGQTHTIFEDFSSGQIKCLRFGTPPVGSALHDSILKMYVNGDEDPVVNTTCGRFFSANFDDPIYWDNTKYLARLSKKGHENPKNIGQHSSFFRYINLPYTQSMKMTLTAPDDSEINGFDNVYYNSAKSSAPDLGLFATFKCLSCHQIIKPDEALTLAEFHNAAALTSIQLMTQAETGLEYLNSIIQVYINGQDTPVIELPLYIFFFGASPDDNNPEVMNNYSDLWQDNQKNDQAYYSSSCHGWIRRGNEKPYRNVMYRLMEKRPILLNGKSSVVIRNISSVEFSLQSDLIVRSGE